MLGYLEREFVSKPSPYQLSPTQFQKFVAVSKLFPGPLATLVSVRMGFELGGTRGGLLAGMGQILPAFLMILVLAQTSQVLTWSRPIQTVMTGLGLAALAISFQATYRLTRPLYQKKDSALTWPTLSAILVVNAILTYLTPRYEAAFIILSGVLTAVFRSLTKKGPFELGTLLLSWSLFVTCLQASIFTFGSGIAIVPVLKTAFIDQHQWLTAEQFLTGLVFAQVTPGPLVILSTYLGFAVGGWAGAVASTLGTFLPTLFFGTTLMPKLETKMMSSPALKVFFDGLLPAVCGAILGAMFALTQISITQQGSIETPKLIVVIVLSLLAILKNTGVWTLFGLGILGSTLASTLSSLI
jgi:chromate transporter